MQRLFLPIPAGKLAETFAKVWKECWWQLRIFKHKSYGETALKPARGSGGGAVSGSVRRILKRGGEQKLRTETRI